MVKMAIWIFLLFLQTQKQYIFEDSSRLKYVNKSLCTLLYYKNYICITSIIKMFYIDIYCKDILFLLQFNVSDVEFYALVVVLAFR